MKIIPPGITFRQAVQFGYVGEVQHEGYRKWLKTHDCATCRAGAPSDPSHLNSMKGTGTKSIIYFAIPQCRECHERYERDQSWISQEEFIAMACFYVVQAICEGKLRWSGAQ